MTAWVSEMASLCRPERVHWCDGSDAEYHALCDRLVRGGTFEKKEGDALSRNVVIEFPTYQAALDCYNSPEYAAAKAKRDGGGPIDLIVIEGYEGAQP